jgi:tRNA (cytidine/uridine-2'-O-)-methyltransferase
MIERPIGRSPTFAFPMPSVVLVNPQIPPNTGNIARTCAATCTPLHLVGPLGFEISNRYLKRAGLDYWEYVDLHYHSEMQAFQTYHAQQGGRWIGFSTSGLCSYTKFQYRDDDWLLFGCETTGLPPEVLAACHTVVKIPMAQPGVRSLNLSVSAALGLFEARRQLGLLD